MPENGWSRYSPSARAAAQGILPKDKADVSRITGQYGWGHRAHSSIFKAHVAKHMAKSE